MFEGDVEREKRAIEIHFQQLKEQRLNTLMNQLTAHERQQIDDVIDRQTQEMLMLIDEKVTKITVCLFVCYGKMQHETSQRLLFFC